MRNKQSETQTSWIGFLVFVFIVIMLFVWHSNEDDAFKAKSVVSTGIVYDMAFVSPYKGTTGTKFYYKYKVNGKLYEGVSDTKSGNSSRYKSFENKTFPLLYNPSKPEESYLLVTQSDYDKFELTMPDSMKWVRNY